jgi:hypothetical protein
MKYSDTRFNLKKSKGLALVQVGLLGVTLLSGVVRFDTVLAAAPGAVIINEVAWAGSSDSANDEWIELYNTTGAAVDLSGWKLKDDGADALIFPAGAAIAAHGYAVIEDSENTVSTRTADFIYNMSLANSGDSLQLVDASSAIVDTVNGSGGAWYAGSSTSYATMERKDALAGDVSSNFDASTGGSGALASAGAVIIGTPGVLNSVSVPSADQTRINAQFTAQEVQAGQTVTLSVKSENVADLFAYGYELSYDPALLEYQGVTAGDFLGEGGAVSTSFQSGLKAGQAGQLLVAEARTVDPKTGRTGSGELFTVDFKVLGGEGTTAAVNFAVGSFSSSTSGDLSISMLPASLNVIVSNVFPVTNFQVTEGSGRYSIKLSWAASVSNPDHYRVERKDVHGQWLVLSGVTGTEFTDQDGVSGGGAIIPKLAYQYRVSAVKGALISNAVEISAQDSRGVKGDNNRSDLVDGRDLERLARHFAEADSAAGFDHLIDTTYDGLINGSDLIDLGAGFAQKY